MSVEHRTCQLWHFVVKTIVLLVTEKSGTCQLKKKEPTHYFNDIWCPNRKEKVSFVTDPPY